MASIIPSDQFDQAVLKLVNQERSQRDLTSLTLSEKLDTAADLHSQDMLAKNYFDHRGKDGSSPGQRIERAGYTEWNTWGENIAQNQSTAKEVVQDWMESPGHRENILSGDFTHMGLGYAADESAGGEPRWTQVFGAGDPNPGQYVAQTTKGSAAPTPNSDPTPAPTPDSMPAPNANSPAPPNNDDLFCGVEPDQSLEGDMITTGGSRSGQPLNPQQMRLQTIDDMESTFMGNLDVTPTADRMLASNFYGLGSSTQGEENGRMPFSDGMPVSKDVLSSVVNGSDTFHANANELSLS